MGSSALKLAISHQSAEERVAAVRSSAPSLTTTRATSVESALTASMQWMPSPRGGTYRQSGWTGFDALPFPEQAHALYDIKGGGAIRRGSFRRRSVRQEVSNPQCRPL
jgi:hypothetical protein